MATRQLPGPREWAPWNPSRAWGAEVQRSVAALHCALTQPPQPHARPPVNHYRSEDYKLVGTAVAIGAPVGYFIGARRPLPLALPDGRLRVPARTRPPQASVSSLSHPLHHYPPPKGYKHYVPRQSMWFGVFMFGTAALAHTTQRVAGEPGRAGLGAHAAAAAQPPWSADLQPNAHTLTHNSNPCAAAPPQRGCWACCPTTRRCAPTVSSARASDGRAPPTSHQQ